MFGTLSKTVHKTLSTTRGQSMSTLNLNIAFIGAGGVNFGGGEGPWNHVKRIEQLNKLKKADGTVHEGEFIYNSRILSLFKPAALPQRSQSRASYLLRRRSHTVSYRGRQSPHSKLRRPRRDPPILDLYRAG